MITSEIFISVFDLFKIGIGPSSSHTVGPMRAAREFADTEHGASVESVTVELFGSLAATGIGHGTVQAVVLGLAGFDPATIDPDDVGPDFERIREESRMLLGGRVDDPIVFSPAENVILRRGENLPLHPNGMRFTALLATGDIVIEECYSIGGGFVVHAEELGSSGGHAVDESSQQIPYPFADAAEMLALCASHSLTIDELVRANEETFRTRTEIDRGLDNIWEAMQDCVRRGLNQEGILPGGLQVPRRAKKMHAALQQELDRGEMRDAMEWIGLYALAVNEENAAGGRVVTAPTNGAAGIIPAVLHHYIQLSSADAHGIRRFLLTAAAIGTLFKRNASISGAEVGCQGEVGSACAMAAGGLAAVFGGTPEQIENAAEIGIEHNLGLTCDPVSGLVQIPCIERNAIASVKAVAAARMSLRGDGGHHVSLDAAIETVRVTGADMSHKYKETSLGGLAVNVIEC